MSKKENFVDIWDMYAETRRLQQLAIEQLVKEFNEEIRQRWWFREKVS